jgi:hypothetical protein
MNKSEVPILQEPDPRDKNAFLNIVTVVLFLVSFWTHIGVFLVFGVLLFALQVGEMIEQAQREARAQQELATIQTTASGRPIPPGYQPCRECQTTGYNQRGDGKHTGEPCWKCGGAGYTPKEGVA